ncbi:Uncharacterized protein dnl_45380 [Desulfonema limicola]|uniref:Uncharacterized protein n=1 Tax=Desulfonema limicola TaxID=45656 RepID=A0A975GIB6_9BACT|nr:Uncharacterized protein dnl_45380 [Desulfonema limicola]
MSILFLYYFKIIKTNIFCKNTINPKIKKHLSLQTNFKKNKYA